MKERTKNILVLIYCLLAILLMTFVSCGRSEDPKVKEGYKIIIIDKCEYIIYTYSAIATYEGYGYFSHKGNCTNCIKRKSK